MLSVYIRTGLTKKGSSHFLYKEERQGRADKCAIFKLLFFQKPKHFPRIRQSQTTKIMVLTWIGLDSWHHKGFHKHRT
jgi:hypothetical protein